MTRPGAHHPPRSSSEIVRARVLDAREARVARRRAMDLESIEQAREVRARAVLRARAHAGDDDERDARRGARRGRGRVRGRGGARRSPRSPPRLRRRRAGRGQRPSWPTDRSGPTSRGCRAPSHRCLGGGDRRRSGRLEAIADGEVVQELLHRGDPSGKTRPSSAAPGSGRSGSPGSTQSRSHRRCSSRCTSSEAATSRIGTRQRLSSGNPSSSRDSPSIGRWGSRTTTCSHGVIIAVGAPARTELRPPRAVWLSPLGVASDS